VEAADNSWTYERAAPPLPPPGGARYRTSAAMYCKASRCDGFTSHALAVGTQHRHQATPAAKTPNVPRHWSPDDIAAVRQWVTLPDEV
jgi:hypothetical protein